MAINLGKVSVTPKGVYVSSQAYERLDIVVSNGSSYISLKDNNLSPLTDTLSWQINAAKGDPGAPGIKGDTGYKTIDPYPLLPTDPTPTVVGWYKPQQSSVTPGTNYPNAGNLKSIEGYDTLFYYSGTTWVKSESKLPQVSQNIIKFQNLTFPAASGTQATYNDAVWEVNQGMSASSSDIPSLTSTIWKLISKDEYLRTVVTANSVPENAYTEFYNSGTALNGFYNASGVFTSNTDYKCTPKIPVTAGEIWRYRGKPYAGLSVRGVYGYKADNSIVILVNVVDANAAYVEFTIPTDIIQIAANYNVPTTQYYSIQKKTVNYVFVSVAKDLLGNVTDINNNNVSRVKTGLSIASVGDSITANGAAGSPLKGYQWYLKDFYDFTTYTSYGYSGRALSTFITPDTNSIIEQFINNAVSHDVFTLLAGTNDFRNNMRNGEIGTLNDYKNLTSYGAVGSVTSLNFYQALKAFVLRCYELNPKAKIIFITPLQRDNAGYTSWSVNPVGRTLSDFVNAIREVAEYESIPLVDSFKNGVINMRNITQYTSDGLHPNNEGYKILARSMQPAINKFI
jgi:lysophospholipase L1-like esterase